jgi:Domain of unknown function (DUF5615)
MPAKLYFDVHIPSAVTEGLRRRGVDVLTSQEDGTREQPDEILLQRAVDLERILFSQDTDLLALANQWQAVGRSFPGVVYSAQLGISLGRLVEDLELLAYCAAPEELSSRVIHLPLR